MTIFLIGRQHAGRSVSDLSGARHERTQEKPPPGSPAKKGVKDKAKQPGSPAMKGTNKRQSESLMRRPASSPRRCPKRENGSSPMRKPAAVEQDEDDEDEENEDDEKTAARAR